MSGASRVEAVVFDWDGTLIDSKEALIATYHEATAEVLGQPYPTEEADIQKIVQLRGKESFDLIAKGDADLAERIAAAFHRAYKEKQAATQPFPGTVEALGRLRAGGVRIGVATSKARVRVDLEGGRTGLAALVDAIVSGDDVERAKPDPEAVVKAIELLGADPAATLYVGDGPNDVRAARGAGAIAVGVSYGFHPDEVRAERPDHLIDHPSELVELAGVGAVS